MSAADDDEEVLEYEFGPGDGKRLLLLIHELETLRDEMRVIASPHAEWLERVLERFFARAP